MLKVDENTEKQKACRFPRNPQSPLRYIEDMQRMLQGSGRVQSCGDIPIILGVPVSLASLNALWTIGVMAAGAVMLKRGHDMSKAGRPAEQVQEAAS